MGLKLLRRHAARIVLTLLPVVLALLGAVGVWQLPAVERLDNFIYDARLRASTTNAPNVPNTPDPRIVIVDIDDASLQQFGHWPWSRDKLARLSTELLERQQAAVLGFDILFPEPDGSSGLAELRRLADGRLRGQPGFATEVERLAASLDHDAAFAKALAGRPVVLGYYFDGTRNARANGYLPAPVLRADAFDGASPPAVVWNGFGGNIAPLVDAAPRGGFINVLMGDNDDGVVRAVPLLARYEGGIAPTGYYASFALAVYQLAGRGMQAESTIDGELVGGGASVTPLFATQGVVGRPLPLAALQVGQGATQRRVPVDQNASMLVPYRGPGGVGGGSFRYVRAGDVLRGELPPGALRDKIVLVGTTARGLQDLRATPVGSIFPGVEVHANIISGLLDARFAVVPDYAAGYDVVQMLFAGLLLAFGMSVLPAFRAVLLGVGTAAMLVVINMLMYARGGLVMPLAAVLVMTALAFMLNLSWGFFLETRARRGLALLFGSYVPPQLVDEMMERPERYSMRAENKELTVMFCDMRGFTRLSQQVTPTELQALLNTLFSRLTAIISRHRGTVDKYMGDCVMAFWGAPVDTPDHAALAVQAAFEMAAAVREFDEAQRLGGRPRIDVGIGLNTGVMSVGDMGSAVRRSYTVVGDAVNLAARLESLSSTYGVPIVATDATRRAAPDFAWQTLDTVYVRGSAHAVAICTPVGRAGDLASDVLAAWEALCEAYRAQRWEVAVALLASLEEQPNANKVLVELYRQRIASNSAQPPGPHWDGATRFDTK